MKKGLILLTILFAFFVSMTTVQASSCELFAGEETQILADKDYEDNCDALFGDPDKEGDFAYYLQIILDVMKYLGIILCIVLTIVDFFKALMGEDKELYKPLTKTMFTRLFYAVALFFLPSVVRVLLGLLDIYGTCNIG